MPVFAEQLRGRGAGLRVLNLGGGDVDTATPMGSMVFTVMAALAQMELEINRERIVDSVAKRRTAGKDMGGRRPTFTNSQIRKALRLIETGRSATQVGTGSGHVQGHSLSAGPGTTFGDCVSSEGQAFRSISGDLFFVVLSTGVSGSHKDRAFQRGAFTPVASLPDGSKSPNAIGTPGRRHYW